MPNPTLDRLAADVRQDPALGREFHQINTIDELVDKTLSLAHTRGYDVTEEEVQAYLLEAANREALSEEELDQVAGGACSSSIISCCCCCD